MNILFLDIDGVLNSKGSLIGIGPSIPEKDPLRVIFDPVAMGLLREMCKECEMKIYIHSTWAGGQQDRTWFRSVFSRYGISAEVLDKVHRIEERNQRIQAAIDHYKPDRLIILDDDPVCQEFGSDFIHVDNNNGLSWSHYARALRMFNKDIPLILM